MIKLNLPRLWVFEIIFKVQIVLGLPVCSHDRALIIYILQVDKLYHFLPPRQKISPFISSSHTHSHRTQALAIKVGWCQAMVSTKVGSAYLHATRGMFLFRSLSLQSFMMIEVNQQGEL